MRHSAALAFLSLAGACSSGSPGSVARDDAAAGPDISVAPVWDAAAFDVDPPDTPRLDGAAVDVAVDYLSADILVPGADAAADDMPRPADALAETTTDLSPKTRCDPDRALDYFYFQAGTSYPRQLGERMQRIWQGSTLVVVSYRDRGGDQLWLTSDDVVDSYTRMDTNGNIRVTRAFTGSGPDGKWFTDDDVEPSSSMSWRCETLDAQGRVESFTTPSGRGPDGKLCTSDDTLSGAGRWMPAIESNMLFLAPDSTKEVTYSGQGPDNAWLTSDDVIVQMRRFENAPGGTTSNIYVIDKAGADGTWGTADDHEFLSRVFTYVDADETDMRMFLNGSFSYGLNFYCTTPAPF